MMPILLIKPPNEILGGLYSMCSALDKQNALKHFKWITPYEKYHGTKPNLEHLKVFGCLCFVSTLKQGRHKFSERAQKCVFLGYSISKKGYKLFDIEQNTEIVSKDVIFYERLFPYHFMKDKSNLNELKSFFLPEFSDLTSNTAQENNLHNFNHLHDFTSVIMEDTHDEEQHSYKDSPVNDTIIDTNMDNNCPIDTHVEHIAEISNENPTDTHQHQEVTLRRSQRIKTTPAYLQDTTVTLPNIGVGWLSTST